MLLLLVRHAQAAEQDDARYPDDTLRPLVPRGRRAQRRMTRQLVKRDLVPGRILASPWKRAWQSARILQREAGLPRSARVPCEALAEPPDLARLAEAVGEAGPEEIIALVGHEPWMSQLAALLLTGRGDSPRIGFAKSAVMAIETDAVAPGAGTLVAFLVP
jgi:phosphohistidine phosphatase